jgi:hypothetical protein
MISTLTPQKRLHSKEKDDVPPLKKRSTRKFMDEEKFIP